MNKSSTNLSKLILIGHNNAGKTNVLRAIELMLLNAPMDINLRNSGIKNINGALKTPASLKIGFNMGKNAAHKLVLKMLSLYQNKLLSFKEYLEKKLSLYLSSFEIQYVQNKEGTVLKYNVYLPSIRMNIQELYSLCKEHIASQFGNTLRYNFSGVDYKDSTIVPSVKNQIAEYISSSITILTQDRGLIQTKLSKQVLTYERTIEYLKKFCTFEHNKELFKKLNEQLKELTNYTIYFKYTIKNFLKDLRNSQNIKKYLMKAKRLNNKSNVALENICSLLKEEFVHSDIDDLCDMLFVNDVTQEELEHAILLVFNYKVICNRSQEIR